MKKFLAFIITAMLGAVNITSVTAQGESIIYLDKPVINAYDTAVISGIVKGSDGKAEDSLRVTLKVMENQTIKYIEQRKTNAFGSFVFRCNIDNFPSAQSVELVVTDEKGSVQSYTLDLADNGCELLNITIPGIEKEPEKIDNMFVFFVSEDTDVSKVKAEFLVSENATAYVGGTIQKSGESINSFENAVRYTVVAQNGEKKDYIVAVVKNNSGYIHAEVNHDDGSVILSGTVPAKNKDISVVTSNKGTGLPVNVMQVTSDADGKYSHTFKVNDYMNMTDSSYNVKVAFGNRSIESDFELYGKNAVKEIINEICTQSGTDEFVEAVKKYEEAFNLDTGIWYEYLKTSGNVIGLKNRLLTKLNSTGYETAKEFKIYFNEAVVLTCVQCIDTSDRIYDILKHYSADFSFPIDENSEYCNIVNKADVWNKIHKNNYADIDLLNKAISDNVVITMFNEADRSNIAGLMQRYEEELSFKNYSSYSVSESEYIQKSMLDGKYTTVLQITEAYEKASDELADSGKKPSGGGGSSSGGGGGSSGGGYIAPIKDSETQNESSSFTDLETVAWAKEAIESLARDSIVSGVSEGIFEPNRSIKREEFVVMMVRAFGYYNEDAQCSFSDMPDSHWAYKYIASASEEELVHGSDDGTFGTGGYLTREDMAVIAYRFAKSAGKKFLSDEEAFSDDELISQYAKEAVYAMKASGIINGVETGVFSPKTTTTRAMAAKVIYSILKN